MNTDYFSSEKDKFR